MIVQKKAKEVSDCCKSDMIPPDWEMAEEMGSLWRACVCYICKECGQECEPTTKTGGK